MATFTATAGTSSTIAYVQYGSSSWNTGTSNGACQGAYQGTTASKSRVGVMVFTGADTALKGKMISEIALKITCSSAGSSGSNKKLSFRRAVYQTHQSGLKGSEYVGAALGTLTGKFYGNTVTHKLNSTTNTALFNAMAAYFAEGHTTLVLYNGETSSSSGYSTNYARITKCIITVTYMDVAVWYCNAGEWIQCTMWYCQEGTWIQVVPYYNSSGEWIRV